MCSQPAVERPPRVIILGEHGLHLQGSEIIGGTGTVQAKLGTEPPSAARHSPQRLQAIASFLLFFGATSFQFVQTADAGRGQLALQIVDAADGQPLAARMQLINAKGRLVIPKGVVRLQDHFYVDGSLVLDLAPGVYRFLVERGLEYREHRGHFEISGGDRDHRTIELSRFVSMSDQGWWSADLQCHSTSSQLPLMMNAEDLHLAVAFAKPRRGTADWSQRSGATPPRPRLTVRPVLTQSIIDIRSGVPLLICRPGDQGEPPLAGVNQSPLVLHTVDWLGARASLDDCWHYAGHAAAWELPLWIASRRLDAIMIMSPPGKVEEGMIYMPDATSREDKWSETVYHRLLECGLRIPPVAGSGSGWSDAALGSYRTYAHIRSDATLREWWKSLKLGRLMLTNGPLLIPTANGRPPGYLFTANDGQIVSLDIGLTLHTRQKIEYLEIIKNGRVEHSVRLDAWAKANHKLPEVAFAESGWMLVRAVTKERSFHQYAMSAPYFVKIGERQRVSRSAVTFFRQWLWEDFRRKDEALADEVTKYYRAADRFWQAQLTKATVD